MVKIGTFNVQFFSSIKHDGLTDGKCEMDGVVSWVSNIAFKYYHSKGFNCSLFSYDEIGSFNHTSQSYNGMIGALMDGELDTLAMPVYYPLHSITEDKIEASVTFAEDTMSMMSMYNLTREQNEVDILVMYGAVPLGVWMGILASYLLFTMALHFALKLFKSSAKTDAGWLTTIAFLDQDNFPTPTGLVSALSLLVSVSMFFLMSYATNCIGTDLVVVERPSVISNYEDFIDRAKSNERGESMAAFCKLFAEYERYRDAPSGDSEQQVFKHAILLSLEISTVLKYIDPFMEQRVIGVGRDVFVEGISYAALKMLEMRHSYDSRILWSQEESPKKYTNVMAWGKESDPIFQIEIRAITTRLHETGLLQHTYTSAPVYVAENVMKLMGGEFTPSLMRKLTKRVEEVGSELVAIGIDNMKTLCIIYFCIIIFATFILFYEMIDYKVPTSRASIKRGKIGPKQKPEQSSSNIGGSSRKSTEVPKALASSSKPVINQGIMKWKFNRGSLSGSLRNSVSSSSYGISGLAGGQAMLSLIPHPPTPSVMYRGPSRNKPGLKERSLRLRL